MKPYFSLLVFIVLMCLSLLAGTGSYMTAENDIRRDLSSALSLTLAERGGALLTPDTVEACRRLQSSTEGDVSLIVSDDFFNRCISIPQLRGKSYISLSILADGRSGVSALHNGSLIACGTKVMRPRTAGHSDVRVAFRGCAECSFMTVLKLSDQRMSLSLSFMAMLWAAFSLYYMRRRKPALMPAPVCADALTMGNADVKTIGGMTFNATAGEFYDATGSAVRLTPMQYRLMEMFFNSPAGKLSKQEICDGLWPRKPDANDTLYTLIRRLKPVIEQAAGLTVESERGRAYVLKATD